MKKIFTFAAALLASLTMAAQTTVWESDFVESIDGVTQTKGRSSDSWGDAPSWADPYTKAFLAGGSSSVLTLTFNEAISLNADDSIFIYWGATSNRNLKFGINGDSPEQIDAITTASERSLVRCAKYIVTETMDLASLAIAVSGSNSFFLHIAIVGPGAPSTDPVESAEISGENACAIGGSVELTCNAPKATTYQWSMNGAEIEGATAKKYTFTPSAAGEYSFTCAASNDYTTTPVVADAHVVTVTDPAAACGELIKATHTGGKTATVTGVLGGTADKNTASDGKFGGKGQYFGITLAAGSFMAGDELNVHTSTAAQQGTIAIYADKAGTTLLYDTESMGDAGDNVIILPTALNNATTLYICRTEANTWNGYVDYIAVTRSCEASNNANIASMTINDEAVAEAEGVFNYTVAASAELAQVEVVYTLAHPLATATPASGFTIDVPAAGADANTQVITVTAQDGTTVKQYTVSVSKSDAASTEAHLSALSVMGYTLAPVFEEDVFTYSLTKAYGAENPSLSAVVADPKDVNAQANVAVTENGFSITVTAEDGITQLVYTITVVEAAARKDLLMVRFSNNVHGYIANGIINVPYLAGTEEPVFESASFWNPDGEPTAEMVEGNLVVTGIDGQSATYTIYYVSVTPMEPNYEEITFDGVPSYVYSIYGWDADKGLKFSKDVEEASNHRISEGKDRIFMALPKALSVTLTSGTSARPVKIYVNGSITGITSTPAKNETIQIPLDGSKNNYVVIESEKNNGDAGFTKMQLAQPWPTAVENTEAEVKAVKVVRNGQLFIEKNGVLYNAQGAVVK